ncbi:hypothetical protein Scep_030579 [Stephania cephalantha]|uniref:Uncharacterized protein n=1 Tax=Stephania cephalantha TaxID=152367 RepID=A0AAP0E339_9MAGN
MDRMSRHPVYTRQRSNASSVSGAPSSPTMSPMHRHVRSGSSGVTNFRRTQNQAAKAAAQRLAQVMANQTDDDGGEDEDEDDDDLSFDYSLNPVLGVGLSSVRAAPPRSHALGRNPAEQLVSTRSTLSSRPSVKTAALPSAVPIMLRPPTSMAENPVGARKAMPVHTRKDSYSRRDKRAPFDMGASNIRGTDEDFEDEASSSGEDIASELSREEATFRQQEGLKNERETTSRVEEWIKTRDKVATKPSPRISSLRYNPSVRLEAETARDKAASSLNEPEGDMSSLQILAKKMMLTEEEMEEVVLKRCWLARYWNLCST